MGLSVCGILESMRTARRSREKILFGVSVALNSALMDFLYSMLMGTFVYEGEAAMGVGMLWAFSLPATGLLGLACAVFFDWYESGPSGLPRYLRYLALVVAVATASVVLTIGAIRTFAG